MQFTAMAPGATTPGEPSHRSATVKSDVGGERIRIEQHSFSGILWLVGWLFTIGFLELTFGKAAFAIVVWPYYLGATLRTLVAVASGS